MKTGKIRKAPWYPSAVAICIGVLLPLFMGIVHAAFYEELIGEGKRIDR